MESLSSRRCKGIIMSSAIHCLYRCLPCLISYMIGYSGTKPPILGVAIARR